MATHDPHRAVPLVAAIAAAALCSPAPGQQHPSSVPPGYRPPTEHAAAFVDCGPGTTIMVFPTVVRSMSEVAYSETSRERIVLFLEDRGTSAIATDARIDLGPAPHASQWDLYNTALRTMSAARDRWSNAADYALMMEVILAPGGRAVFGIETYLLDREGRNAFSFLLNSHHEVFGTADLFAADETEDARAAMVAEATRVGLAAMEAQLDHMRECMAWAAANPATPGPPGVFEDFESGLPATRDPYGIQLGYSTFTDGPSSVRMNTTADHPPRPGSDATEGRALRLDFDVTGWAGFAHLLHEADESPAVWRPQDWSDADGLSFWMYGENTGTRLFVDILDNRHPCSFTNDAETWVYEFTDDFEGWAKVVVPFDELVRKEIGNGAPNDGLGLSRVHGWAFGATTTGGPKTWFIDDVALWRASRSP